MSQRTLGDQKAQSRIDEVERGREIGERLGEMDERIKAWERLAECTGYDPKGLLAVGEELIRRDKQLADHQLALQGLADALKQMLAVFPPEFDEKWVESSGEKIQVQAWNQARAALKAVAPFLEEK